MITIATLHNSKPHVLLKNEPLIEKCPEDILALVLTFLSKDYLDQTRVINKQMNTLSYLVYYYQNCMTHPQWINKNTLSKYLIAETEKNPEQKLDNNLIAQYFRNKFGANNIDLLMDFESSRNHLLSWATNRDALGQYFYSNLYPSSLVATCDDSVQLIKQVDPDYKTIFCNINPKLGDIKNPQELPLKLSLLQYRNVLTFLDTNYYLEKVWANMVFTNSIVAGANRRTANLNQRVIDSFSNFQMTENITFKAFIFISGLSARVFNMMFLIENPTIFFHLKKLSKDKFVFIVNEASQGITGGLNFLATVLGFDEVRQKLFSADYLEMARVIQYKKKLVLCERALVILSIPEVIKQLTDEDLLALMYGTWEKVEQLLLDNSQLEKRMTGDLWIDLVKQSSNFADIVAKVKNIYSLFSQEQLKYLITDACKSSLLNDDEILLKLRGFFTEVEIKDLQIDESPDLIAKIKTLEPKKEIIKATEWQQPSNSDLYYPHPFNFKSPRQNSYPLQYEVKEIPAEEKRQPIPLPPKDRLGQTMKATLAIASLLLQAGTASGIAMFFVPHLLALTIGLLGAALLTFGVYGAMHCYKHGFFSSSTPAPMSANVANTYLSVADNNRTTTAEPVPARESKLSF